MLSDSKVRFAICPVCVAVAGTWIAMVFARFLGLAIDPVLLAVLIGASAVGITDAIERRLPPRRSPALSKLILLPPGLVAAYGVATGQWAMAAFGVGLFAVGMAFFLRPVSSPRDEAAVRRLEEQMKRCC
jgi:hypothetical protein